MSNLKIKAVEDLMKKIGLSQEELMHYWQRQSTVNLRVACCEVEEETPEENDESEDFLVGGRYPFLVLYADNTISAVPQEDRVPVAIVLSSRYALKLRRPEDHKKFRKPYEDAIALAQEDVLGRKATAGSREFWRFMVGMNAKELESLRRQMVHLGSEPLGRCCWIADVLDEDYAWRASFADKTLATCFKGYFSEVWSIFEL